MLKTKSDNSVNTVNVDGRLAGNVNNSSCPELVFNECIDSNNIDRKN